MEKKWYESKTIWLSVIALVAIIAHIGFTREVNIEKIVAILIALGLITGRTSSV